MKNIAEIIKNQVSQARFSIQEDKSPTPVQHLPAVLTPVAGKLLNELASYHTKFKSIYVSHETLAKRLGYTSRSIRRGFRLLKEHGAVSTTFRLYRTNLTRISPALFTQEAKNILASQFRNFRYLALGMLATTGLIGQCPTIKKKEKNDIRSSVFIIRTRNEGRLMTVPSPISSRIKKIKCFSLTKWSQILLSCFENSAIDYAEERFEYAKPRDPFKFFYSLCLEYSRREGLFINHNYVTQLKEKYPVPPNARMFLRDSSTIEQRVMPKYEQPSAPVVESYLVQREKKAERKRGMDSQMQTVLQQTQRRIWQKNLDALPVDHPAAQGWRDLLATLGE